MAARRSIRDHYCEFLVRVVFDLEARRKPQAFAAAAVPIYNYIWNFNSLFLIALHQVPSSPNPERFVMAASTYACFPPVTHILTRPQNYSSATNAAAAPPAASFLAPTRKSLYCLQSQHFGNLAPAVHLLDPGTLELKFNVNVVSWNFGPESSIRDQVGSVLV
jgi:hypothetical protein